MKYMEMTAKLMKSICGGDENFLSRVSLSLKKLDSRISDLLSF